MWTLLVHGCLALFAVARRLRPGRDMPSTKAASAVCKEAECKDEAAAGGTCSSAAEGIDTCCKAIKQGCVDEAAAGWTRRTPSSSGGGLSEAPHR